MTTLVWVPSDTEAWIAAQLISSDAHSITIRYLGDRNREEKLPMPGGSSGNLETIPDGALDIDCANLVDLESFSEGNILHHIRKRFKADVIYTFVGNILVALNPYKSLQGLYELPVIDHIYQMTKNRETCPPHVYSIGATAVQNMRNEDKDQSVLISGESGAGKTEATKRLLQFVSTVCGSSKSRVGDSIENQILDSNPLLESFGNAKTIRNNNSSRFGKYMEINFEKRSWNTNVKGCNITSYLLEKSRVVRQGANERNYHIFYMLLAGATKTMKNDFALKPADQFNYLLQNASSSCFDIPGRSELKEFEDMVFAMNSLAIDFTIQNTIFQLVAAVLHVGNLQFTAVRDQDGGSKVAAPQECRRVANLLGVNPDTLEKALCSKQSMVNHELLVIPLSPEQAVDQRDALAKYIYGKLFDAVVSRVNAALYRGKPGRNIGLLDIFGFEVFQLNSFEQLCINYCNERLQTFFNEIIFEAEMHLYSEEGLPCDDIAYQDNVGCVRLIDLRGAGIFAYLDEEIAMPKGSDEKFVSKLDTLFDEHKATRSVYYSRVRKHPLEFAVRHFAGDVTYNAQDFMEKNKDALAEGLVALLQHSSVPLLLDTNDSSAEVTTPSSGGKRTSKMTLAAKFKKDLDSLMTSLRSTSPHFIRCVKPNSQQKAVLFDSPLVLDQLKYSGLFEAIRIRKSGYAVRMPLDIFIRRYRHCESGLPAVVRGDPVQHAHSLLLALDERIDYAQLAEASAVPSLGGVGRRGSISSKRLAANTRASRAASMRGSMLSVQQQRQYAVGKSRVFLRSQQYQLQLEKLREQNQGNCAVPIQQLIRGFLVRRRFQQLQGERVKRLQQQRMRESEERTLMDFEHKLSAAVEDAFRSDFALQQRLAEAKRERIRTENERIFKLHTVAAVKIQQRIRGTLQRRLGRIFMCEQMLERALAARDEAMINRSIQMPAQFNVTSKLIRMYQTSAKQLILEVLSEAYVANALQDAVAVGSVRLLREAIHRAQLARMPYLPQLQEAKQALERCLTLRSTLSRMQEILAHCNSVPKLVAAADELQLLVQQATAMDLVREYVVQDVAQRLHRIRNLLSLRDRLRFSVELCCPSRMKSAIMERSKLLRVYGPDLMLREQHAVEGMFRMLNYQQHVDITQLQQRSSLIRHDGNSSGTSNVTALSMHQLYDVINELDDQSCADDIPTTALAADIYLPPFVTNCLVAVRDATDAEALSSAMLEFTKLVPDELKRRFYLRIFKWVVAFATWKFTSQSALDRKPTDGINTTNSTSISLQLGSATTEVSSNLDDIAAAAGSPFLQKGSGRLRCPINYPPDSPERLQQNSSSPRKSARGKDKKGPFAQRQARSEVAAHEFLKKGKTVQRVDFNRQTDISLQKSIDDYERFVQSELRSASTFRG